MSERLSYTRKEAAEATGLSEDTLKRAINAGDLRPLNPKIQSRSLQKVLIHRDELERWLRGDDA